MEDCGADFFRVEVNRRLKEHKTPVDDFKQVLRNEVPPPPLFGPLNVPCILYINTYSTPDFNPTRQIAYRRKGRSAEAAKDKVLAEHILVEHKDVLLEI